jgi:hypothetical protein
VPIKHGAVDLGIQRLPRAPTWTTIGRLSG